MRISELIKELESVRAAHGDCIVIETEEFSYSPTVKFEEGVTHIWSQGKVVPVHGYVTLQTPGRAW